MKKVHWVWCMYADWRLFRDSQPNLRSYSCNLDAMETVNKKDLNEAMCRFITEVKKVDGSDYPPKTLYDIVICVQFWLETQGLAWKLLNDVAFQELKFTLDNLMKLHTAAGLGNHVKQAEIVGLCDEQDMWEKGLLGTHNPEVLLHTVVYLIGLYCALRAGKEHRSLRSIPFQSQFQYKTDSSGCYYIHYKEDLGLKTNKGGLKQRKLEAKEVDIFPSENVDRCPVRILTKYLELLPKHRVTEAMYLQPKQKFDSTTWYLDRPVGIHTLRKVVKDLCKKSSAEGFYTNHSLRSSSATRMYQGGVDEQLICEVTGHRSLAVRAYKRTSQDQRKKLSQIISGERKSFESN